MNGPDEVSARLHALPGAEIEIIGRSVRGAPLWAVTLGPPDAVRTVAMLAGIHALEWIGIEVALAVIDRLAADQPRDLRLLAVPVVNIDGFTDVAHSRAAGRARFIRANGNGVDLNRNWPTNARGFSLWDPVLALLPWLGGRGPMPRSEPEVDAVCRFLERAPRIARAVSLHSVGNRVLVPYGGRWAPPDDIAAHKAAADALCAHLSSPYRIRQCARWFPGFFARGMEIDHLHDAFGALALLVECTRGGVQLGDPRTWRDPFAWFNPSDPHAAIAELVPAICAFLTDQPP